MRQSRLVFRALSGVRLVVVVSGWVESGQPSLRPP